MCCTLATAVGFASDSLLPRTKTGRTMKVQQILKEKGREVVTTRPGCTVLELIQQMNRHHIGAVVVLNKLKDVIGIATERDVMRRCLKTLHPDLDMRVSEIMTTQLIVGHENDSVQHVMGVMTKNRIRHLPIVSGKHLVGLISIGDVVKSQLQEVETDNRHLVDYITSSGYEQTPRPTSRAPDGKGGAKERSQGA